MERERKEGRMDGVKREEGRRGEEERGGGGKGTGVGQHEEIAV